MAVKKYGLTKQESDRLNKLLSVAQIQQELLNAITIQYKEFLFTVFKRLNVDTKMFPFSSVDLGAGELIIKEPEKPPEPQKVEATGKRKDAN